LGHPDQLESIDAKSVPFYSFPNFRALMGFAQKLAIARCLSVGAVYDRPFLVDSRKNGRS
jgi:hypothetical protein